MNIKSNSKLKTTVLASILALSVYVPNTYAATIGEGAYSWDRDWSLSLSACGNDGVNSSAYSSWLQYTASDGKLTLVFESRVDSHNRKSYTTLGDAKTILGGMSEEDILDIVDDAIHNVQGDQTVNGSQDITGDQTVEGEQTVNGGQTVTGGFYFFNNKV